MFRRRSILGTMLVAPLVPTCANAADADPPEALQQAVRQFGMLSAQASCLLRRDGDGATWQAGLAPEMPLFVGSAVKTFILAQCLRDVEAGSLSEDAYWKVDDTVRSPSSPVLLDLTGSTPARHVLEAMISHSDNTATDIVLSHVGPAAVRALIASAGLRQTRIPDSTRRMISYFAGAPPGEDLGWAGMQRLDSGWTPGPMRLAINDEQAMISTAAELVDWYRRALRGAFFTKAATLVEFKRIQAMSSAISQAFPQDLQGYAKGGNIDWGDFHCLCFAGQMITGRAQISFCFTVNWTAPPARTLDMVRRYRTAVVAALLAAAG